MLAKSASRPTEEYTLGRAGTAGNNTWCFTGTMWLNCHSLVLISAYLRDAKPRGEKSRICVCELGGGMYTWMESVLMR